MNMIGKWSKVAVFALEPAFYYLLDLTYFNKVKFTRNFRSRSKN